MAVKPVRPVPADKPFRLVPADRPILRAAWSLGYAPAKVLRALTSPDRSLVGFRTRLSDLHRAGYLALTPYVLPGGGGWLYSLGQAGLPPGDPRPWRPGVGQILHTVEVGEAVVALTRPGFAAPLQPTGWQGEAELRGWAAPGAPYPDARVAWSAGDQRGSWLLELDRDTESRPAWRRKLARYLAVPRPELVLAVAPSLRRAQQIAALAADMGVPLLATTQTAVCGELDPTVFDAQYSRRRPLSACRLG